MCICMYANICSLVGTCVGTYALLMCACWLMCIDTYKNVHRHIFIHFLPLYNKQHIPANKRRVNRPVLLLADVYNHIYKYIYRRIYKYVHIDTYTNMMCIDTYTNMIIMMCFCWLMCIDIYINMFIDTYTNMFI